MVADIVLMGPFYADFCSFSKPLREIRNSLSGIKKRQLSLAFFYTIYPQAALRV